MQGVKAANATFFACINCINVQEHLRLVADRHSTRQGKTTQRGAGWRACCTFTFTCCSFHCGVNCSMTTQGGAGTTTPPPHTHTHTQAGTQACCGNDKVVQEQRNNNTNNNRYGTA